jgi:hypothetical protein
MAAEHARFKDGGCVRRVTVNNLGVEKRTTPTHDLAGRQIRNQSWDAPIRNMDGLV